MEDLLLGLSILILLAIAFFYSRSFYYNKMFAWRTQLSTRKFFSYLLPILLKSAISLLLIIFIHNSLRDDHWIELTLFIFVFFLFSIFQSAFSISGFFNRNKHVYGSFLEYLSMSSKLLERASNIPQFRFFKHGGVLVKIGIIALFLLVFIPNASWFVTTNLVFIIFIIFLIALSLLQNNLIYFGLISLIVFQYNTDVITFQNIPYAILLSSYIIIAVGVFLETRLERRMFILINMMPVKRFNFNLGYELVRYQNDITIYQNTINHYYYIYFRKLGMVVVYYTELDAKISNIVVSKMVSYGKSYIRYNYNE